MGGRGQAGPLRSPGPHSPRQPWPWWCPGSRSRRRVPGRQQRARSAARSPPQPAPAGRPRVSAATPALGTPEGRPPQRTTASPVSSPRLSQRRPISVTLAKSCRASSSRSSTRPVSPEAPSTKQDLPLPPSPPLPPATAMPREVGKDLFPWPLFTARRARPFPAALAAGPGRRTQPAAVQGGAAFSA